MLYSQTFTKKTPYFFQNGGARARRAGPGSAFDDIRIAGDNHHNGLYFSSIYYAAHNTSSKEMQA